MLPDEELEKLCYGCVVHAANLPDSSGRHKTGPHFCLILNSDEEIKKSGVLTVAAISSDTFGIEPTFRVPVPRRWGLKGFVICSWLPRINENHITRIVTVAKEAELAPIWEMIRKWQASKGSTQS